MEHAPSDFRKKAPLDETEYLILSILSKKDLMSTN